MEERIYLINLFEEYKMLFTESQINIFMSYYFDDLSLSEIAQNNKVSKAFIGKTIKNVSDKLLEYESVLHIVEKEEKIKEILKSTKAEEIKEEIEKILSREN